MMVVNFVMLVLPVFIAVAFITLLERKILSYMGTRVGPNKVSLGGLLQPVTDAVKLSNKQVVNLVNFSFFFFFISSCLMLLFSLIIWGTFFSSPAFFSWSYPILLIMLMLGLNSLNSILCGWSSFSKLSLIGSIRTISQLISYESVLYLCLFMFVCSISSFLFSYSTPIFLGLFFPFCFLIWCPSFLAELNRTPYDFSEGESELVSGFNTEYGSNSFTLIFLAEYANILFFCALSSFLFFSGLFFFFFFFFFFFVIWIRSVLPRYRFDKLMMLAWKVYVPFLTLYFLFCLYFFE